MTLQEAEQIAAEMKKGLAFSDEDMFANEYWCLSYDREKEMYNYCEIWLVIGSILENADYTEEQFIQMLQQQYSYSELMANSFRQ